MRFSNRDLILAIESGDAYEGGFHFVGTKRIGLELDFAEELWSSNLIEGLRLHETVGAISEIERDGFSMIHSFIEFFNGDSESFTLVKDTLTWYSLTADVVTFVAGFIYEDVEVGLLPQSDQLTGVYVTDCARECIEVAMELGQED